MEPVDVTACLVTRGNVPLEPILATFPPAWKVMVYDNRRQTDLAVFGRYRAVVAAHSPVVYVQDDDVLVSEPQAIVDALLELPYEERERTLVANMPQEFRPHYDGHCLVGFGAAFVRDLPAQVFARWTDELDRQLGGFSVFRRTCDVVFSALAPARLLLDVPKQNLPYAEDEDRMYRQASHVGERKLALDLARTLAYS